MIRAFIRWFDLNLGWFFINGRKKQEWANYLNRKYNVKKN